jgi:hypothetical protein
VAQLVGEWCEGVGFSLAGLCDIYRVSEDDKRNLVERSGFVSGGAARKLLRIACMSAEQFKIESATRQERCVAVLKNRADALGMERSQLLNLLPLQAKSIEVLQKGQARLAPDEFAVLFELTAASEINFLLKLEPTVCVYSCRQLSQLLQAALPRLKRPASEVYDFLRRTFYLGKNVPSDYASLLKRSDKEPVFVASVGVLLRWLGDPKQGVFVSKITKRPAEVGDIYVNLDTGDFGPITAIKSDETGRLAQVSLFIMKRSSDFRVV